MLPRLQPSSTYSPVGDSFTDVTNVPPWAAVDAAACAPAHNPSSEADRTNCPAAGGSSDAVDANGEKPGRVRATVVAAASVARGGNGGGGGTLWACGVTAGNGNGPLLPCKLLLPLPPPPANPGAVAGAGTAKGFVGAPDSDFKGGGGTMRSSSLSICMESAGEGREVDSDDEDDDGSADEAADEEEVGEGDCELGSASDT